jgi:hypothetical protein
MSDVAHTRREILTKAAYITPLLVTFPANLAWASTGSGLPPSRDQGMTARPVSIHPSIPLPPNAGPPPENVVSERAGQRRRKRRRKRRWLAWLRRDEPVGPSDG